MWRVELVTLAAWLAALVAGFNVDTAHPLLWSGQPGSYFGYTVALRHLAGDKYRLVVGAPRANSTYITHRRLMEPGAVYHCNIQDITCEQLALDLSGNVNHTLVKTYFKYQDKKDNAWIGGSIAVQQTSNSPMMVCAPCWKNSIEPGYYMMNGMCYLSKADSEPDAEARIIYPLSDPYLRAFPSKPVPGKIQRFYYAYGGAGLSTHFTKNGMELLIGAPGVFDWTGTVVVYRNAMKDVRIPNPLYTPLHQNPQDYFGYAVGSGTFFRKPKEVSGTLYVSGAPRAGNLHGKVFVFGLPLQEDRPLDVRVEKTGEQFGEYFGASLCVVDLNADGLDDLVVGAPRHSLKELGLASWDEGRVYVFLSHDQGRLEEVTGNDKIVGDGETGAHFGTSIATLGDINMDGYPDIAVGAPYGGKEESGAIYIYHGHRAGINTKYSQQIIGSDISKSIRGFGISISNGMDIDGNSYNDLAVGAYQSDDAVILRASPIVAVRAELVADLKNIVINATSFQVASCISYSGEHAPSSIYIRYIMVVDPAFARAYFSLGSHPDSSTHTENVRVFNNVTNCKNFTVKIKPGQKDFAKPLDIKLDYSLQDDVNLPTRRRRGAYEDFCKECPVLDPSQSTSVLLHVPFATGCQHDDVCRTDLRLEAEIVSAAVPLVLGNQTMVTVVATVESHQDPAFLARVLIEAPHFVALARMPSSCRKELAYEVLRLRCDVGNPLVLQAGPRTITVELDVKDIPEKTTELVFNVTAVSTSQELRPSDNGKTLTLEVRTSSDIRMVGLSHQDTLYFNQANDTSSATNGELTYIHSYQVRNYGPSKVDSVELVFKVPIAVTVAGKKITFNKVYLPKTSLNGQPFFCSASDYKFSDDSFSWSNAESNDSEVDLSLLEQHRKRRSASDVVQSWGDAAANRSLLLNCSLEHTTCITVTCSDIGPFPSIQTSATVQLRMRMQVLDLVPVLGERSVVFLLTSGTLSYQKLPNSLHPSVESSVEKTVATMFVASAAGKGLETWMLVLAIMAGLLLFLLLVLGLVKAGFFHRSKKEALLHLKTKTDYDDDDDEREAL